MSRDTGRRGMRARENFYKKVKNITPEQALENFREKQRRLAEKLGWENDWHKRSINLDRKKCHKNRVKHKGHGK